MKKMKLNYILLFFILCSTEMVQSQTVSFPVTKDTYVKSNQSTTNFGTATSLLIYDHSTPYSSRLFLDFDISSIPANAQIVSATLKGYTTWMHHVHPIDMYLQRVNSSWTETGITWSNMPTTNASTQISIPNNSVNFTGWHSFDVTSHVSDMHTNPTTDHGWCLKLQVEANPNKGGTYWAKEIGDPTKFFTLEVQYQVPLEVSGVVSHSDFGANNGSISPAVSGGSGVYTQYTWLKYDNGNSTVIETGTNISNADVSGLSPGLYLLNVVDNQSASEYKYFLVGAYGETTSVCFTTNDLTESIDYQEDAELRGLVPYENNNYGSSAYIRSQSGNPIYSALLKYKVDIPQEFTVNSAELLLFSWSNGHYRHPSAASNAASFQRVIEYWEEDQVTFASKPNVTTSGIQYTSNSTSGFSTLDEQVDMSGFVNHWQANPSENHGIYMEVDLNEPYATRRQYYSFDVTNASKRPQFCLTYKLDLLETEGYARLEREISSAYYQVGGQKLKFEIDGEYYLQANQPLEYSIYSTNMQTVLGVSDDGNTIIGGAPVLTKHIAQNKFEIDFSSLSIAPGNYVLEVISEKNEKRYLRFKLN